MRIKHRVQINVADKNGNVQKVLESKRVGLRKKMQKFLFGEFGELMILSPERSIDGVKHRVQVNFVHENGHLQKSLESRFCGTKNKLLRLLFGDTCEVFVVNAGSTIEGFIVHEVR